LENRFALFLSMSSRRNPRFSSLLEPHDVWKKAWRKKGEPPVEIYSFLGCLQHASRGGISRCRPPPVQRSLRFSALIRIPRSGSTGLSSPCWNQLGSSADENKTNTEVRPSVYLAVTAFHSSVDNRHLRPEALRGALFGGTPRQLASLFGVSPLGRSRPSYSIIN
jgi:hypothetical protein